MAPQAGAVVQGLTYLPGTGEKNFQVRLLLLAAMDHDMTSMQSSLTCHRHRHTPLPGAGVGASI